jgi:hypothetical protein
MKFLVYMTVLGLVSSSIPILLADDSSNEFFPGCQEIDGGIMCTSTGERSEGHYVFAGGSSCCGCVIKHYGELPEGFPNTSVKSVTFYLTISRNNSYYTTIENGPNDLKLILGTGEAVATSIALSNTSYDPVEHTWYLQFEFTPSVAVGEGTSWQLLDGDNNIYSAVWLHASDINQSGLPGTYEVTNCQYAETRSHWYSVMFETEHDTGISDKTIPSDSETPGFTVILVLLVILLSILFFKRNRKES